LFFLIPILTDLTEGSRELGQARIWIQGGVIVEEVNSLLNRAGVCHLLRLA
jgi:predicted CoA-binding protein